ncbi:MAG TPA: glycosyltransferase family 4 protein [Myxococcota bacterium]|nr:glycosyltransferase family 4 protein [Myxococcota bacterium]
MRIAQISPLYEAVPPKGYGGTERVVSWLTEALVAAGHELTLFASGDSDTSARLVPCAPRALRLDPQAGDAIAAHVLMLERAFLRAEEFDVIHAHVDYLSFPFARRVETPVVTTLHGRLDLPCLQPVFREYREQALVSISDAQRKPLPESDWRATIHHGLPRDLYRFSRHTDGYLAFLGRISPEKRVDRAIEIAVRAGRKLLVAAKIDAADRAYYEREIRALFAHPLVEYVGELDDADKQEFLGRADAVLFPIDWPEPFGLIMIEAFACGTPVIAWPHGSVPEVVEPGVNGFLCSDIDSAVRAVENLRCLDRARCRERFEERFTSDRMARDYLATYERLAA